MKKLILAIIIFLPFWVNGQIDDSEYTKLNLIVNYKNDTIKYIFSDSGLSRMISIQKYDLKNDSILFFFLNRSTDDYFFRKIDAKKDTSFSIDFNISSFGIVRKPIIYLYPEKEISVDVKFNFFGNVQNTYPEYYDGWHVIAKPNGEIVNKKDNTVHRYLFWDGTLAKNPEISEFNTGFIVKGTETVNFLDSILTLVGFNQFEKNDFITYWMPVLKKNEYNFVHFLVNENCNNIATMNITPKPDSEIRLYMLFSAIDEPFEIKPQNLKTIERKGFTVIEWGGMDINKLKVDF